jgi:hypothetical protein
MRPKIWLNYSAFTYYTDLSARWERFAGVLEGLPGPVDIVPDGVLCDGLPMIRVEPESELEPGTWTLAGRLVLIRPLHGCPSMHDLELIEAA